jgi:hypothetical protein
MMTSLQECARSLLRKLPYLFIALADAMNSYSFGGKGSSYAETEPYGLRIL